MARRIKRPASKGRSKRGSAAAGARPATAPTAAAKALPAASAAPSTAAVAARTAVEPHEVALELIPAETFDEAGYLRLNPDVRDALAGGRIESAYAHYARHGHAENRPLPGGPRESRNVMLMVASADQAGDASAHSIRCDVDALIIAAERGVMVVGWIDDRTHPLSCIRIVSAEWRVVIDASRLVRVRREDVEKALGASAHHAYGFFGFMHIDRGGHALGPLRMEFWQSGAYSTAVPVTATVADETELRDNALSYLAQASFFGNPAIESMDFLARGVGDELMEFNQRITRRIVATPYVERFGQRRNSPRGSIIVCLYGKAEFFFVQNCLFGGLPGIEDYEFIYVSNSPELADPLLEEARSSELTYGLATTVMILAGNAGFGGANNAAAGIARSDRLMAVNPDVFPRDPHWARKHTALIDAAAPASTRLFGVPLYYDDGSLMHGGMYFEVDVGLRLSQGKVAPQRICRVEHYGKGAPSGAPQFVKPRPVPAVTGAFLSIDKPWFERLGGFSEEFIFGHYEDADLCLKSLDQGVAPWLQDIRLWHLEGKGSSRQLPHEGGSMVNRWLFSSRWMAAIEAGLQGQDPGHPLLQSESGRAQEHGSHPSRIFP